MAIGAATLCAAAVVATGSPAHAADVGDIGYGSSGPGAWCVQQGLDYAANVLHIIPDSPLVDGSFGLQTKEAVEEFQAAGNTTVDGIVGPNTGDLLLDDEWDNGQYDWVETCFPYIPTPPGTTFT